MRRFLILILCCAMLTGTVFAAGRADDIHNTTVVYTDGSADVVLTVNFTLTEPQKDLGFPLPKGVKNVQLNDRPVDTSASRDNPNVVMVELGSLCREAGSYSLVFRYTLPALIAYGEPIKVKEEVIVNGQVEEQTREVRPLILEAPLLSGFEYPVDALSFTVTLPQGVEGSPVFESGYLLQSIESDLEYTLEDGILTGSVTKPMKDKETLRMTMTVEAKDFPDLVIIDEGESVQLKYMAGVAILALLFWMVFLRSLPVIPLGGQGIPAGIHAGEVGSWLTMEGGDLTVMIFQWAQLGYLRIVPDKRDRVWLRKRMDMGNERSPFEVRIFRQLFGNNEMVEGTGSRFARLWHHVRGTVEDAEQITTGGVGARGVFRGIAVLASALSGAAMGQNMLEEGRWQLALMMALAIAGILMGWRIQSAAACLHLRRKNPLPGGILCAGLWIIGATFCDRPLGGLVSVGIQILAGIFAAWGGKRTRAGWQVACQLMGLRHWLTGMKRNKVNEEMERNPDFFFELAPYALALGAESGFAKRFGRRIMPQCGYLEAGRSEKRTAQEWAYLMRQTAEKLDNGAKRIKQYRR